MTEPERDDAPRRASWLWLWILILIVAVLVVLVWAWPAREPPAESPPDVGAAPVVSVLGVAIS